MGEDPDPMAAKAATQGKSSVPQEAGAVFDTEELDRQIKDIIKELNILNDDSKMVAHNIY
jgi:hypothetical protein